MNIQGCLNLFAVFLLSACQPKIAKDDYFPLEKGLTWQYKVTKSLDEKTVEFSQYQVTNTGVITWDDHYQDDDIYSRHTSDGTDYYILRDDIASYRIGKRTVVESKPSFDEPMRKIMPTLYGLNVGETWSNKTQAYLIYSVSPHIMRKDIGSDLSMLFQVEAIDETVEVPSGVYKHCIKIVGTADFSFFADAAQGYKNVPITQTEWYAPRVGMVKLIREEQLNSMLFKGGEISYELQVFK